MIPPLTLKKSTRSLHREKMKVQNPPSNPFPESVNTPLAILMLTGHLRNQFFLERTFQPFGDVPHSLQPKTKDLPRTKEAIDYLKALCSRHLDHSSASATDLWNAFACFRLANELYVELQGRNKPYHTNRLRCCGSRIAILRSAPAIC